MAPGHGVLAARWKAKGSGPEAEPRGWRRQVLKPVPEGSHCTGKVRTRWGAPEARVLSELSLWRGKSIGSPLSGGVNVLFGNGSQVKDVLFLLQLLWAVASWGSAR